MLHAKRIHLPSQQYEFTEDGRALTTFPLGRGSTGARFTLHGADYLVRTHPFSGLHELLDADEKVVAATDRVGRSWKMTCPGRVVTFRQTAAAGREYTMTCEGGEPAGTIRRSGRVRTEATADLPGLEPPVLQVFALDVVLLRRRRKRAAAAVRSTSLAGG
ncbi:hypothetical protein SAZ_01175 [Streptomyces noursei ZPM]|uniref:Uncharacterized protein n=1 Tax=Streptomyces noursei TaxID=1971 RepID=A0A401QS88_STRNR|nr:hypothetical protein [Streptomyces noursei]AKA08340.1 hypothetical protein SAZ_01175 [Streptomyces noursei ZPM]EOS97751.1 hypothetical protein K530_42407 [Streptomyces noursei CCRC 11814]EXU91327.1 hypothetical protein P354_05765 [Streptomyces noursei PD-1]GCB88277.1 hypothetical protein SALB_00947 [Streptomyces noursei]